MMYDASFGCPLITFFSGLLCWDVASAAALTSESNAVQFSNVTVLASAIAGSVAFFVLVIIVILQCGDCYNSEVSSDSHAACGASTTKTQDYSQVHTRDPHALGSVSYHQGNRPHAHSYGTGAPSYGGGAPLPYTLNPTPQSPVRAATAPPLGPGGLGGGQSGWGQGQASAQGQPGYQGQHRPAVQGQHYDGPEQPPSYDAAIRTSSTGR